MIYILIITGLFNFLTQDHALFNFDWVIFRAWRSRWSGLRALYRCQGSLLEPILCCVLVLDLWRCISEIKMGTMSTYLYNRILFRHKGGKRALSSAAWEEQGELVLSEINRSQKVLYSMILCTCRSWRRNGPIEAESRSGHEIIRRERGLQRGLGWGLTKFRELGEICPRFYSSMMWLQVYNGLLHICEDLEDEVGETGSWFKRVCACLRTWVQMPGTRKAGCGGACL